MSGVVAALAAAAAVAGVHQYERLAISPAGDLVAAVESVELPGRAQDPHGVLVVRRADGGAIVATYDPCTSCTYLDPTWSPDGKTLTVIGADRRTHNGQIIQIAEGKVQAAASFPGLLAKPRW